MFDKEYLKRVFIYVSLTLVALIAVFLLGYHMWFSMTSEIETIPAVPRTFSVTARYDAWVFRDEVSVPSAAAGSGTVVPYVRNGEKIGKNETVAAIYPSIQSEKLIQLESVRNQIRLLKGKTASVIGSDMGIGDMMLSLTSATKNGELSEANDIAARLAALVAARSSGSTDTDNIIASLEAQESGLLSSFGTAVNTVDSGISGWYYSDSDGFESVFTCDAVKDLTPEKLDELLGSAPDNTPSAGRIVRTYKWYIAATMTMSDGLCFTEGSETEIKLPGLANPLKFRVESVSTSADSRATVVFSCGIMPENFSVDRHLTLDFTIRQVEGFGIPKDAVRVLDDTTGVYTYNGVMARFRRINIIEDIDDMYIAEVQKDEADAPPPAETTGTGEVTTVVTEEPIYIGGGTGRKEHLFLEVNEFIITKGRALRNGKLIG